MFFNDIPGNKKIKRQLIGSVKKDRISHAQLFSGGRGSAILPIAIAYAQYINCENPTEADSCGDCSQCVKYKNLTHPDLHIIFPVLKSASKNMPLSENFISKWRALILKNNYESLSSWIETFNNESKNNEQAFIYKDEVFSLQKKLTLKNYEARHRVVLIWMPEQMNKNTSNKLLKLFEEPPKGTVFMLVSEKPEKLLSTIRSRFHHIQIKNFNSEEIVSFFTKDSIGREEINELISICGSDLGRMIDLSSGGLETDEIFIDFVSWMRLVYKASYIEIFTWVESISRKGRGYQKMMLSYSLKMIRECLVINFLSANQAKTNSKEAEFILKFCQFVHNDNIVAISNELEQAYNGITRNANPKIMFFNLSLQLVKLLKVKRKFVN